jgi:hypothetical protein
MLRVVSSKTWKCVVALLIVMAVSAVVGCQLHHGSLADAHATSTGHRHTSSTPSLGDFLTCLIAVLPITVMLALFLFSVLHTMPLVLKHAVLVFPPFIPPRYTTSEVRIP